MFARAVAQRRAEARPAAWRVPQAAQVAALTALLLLVGAVLAPASVSRTAIMSMLPFAAILGIAALGQHLVILQRGLDLSVGGSMSLVAVLVTVWLRPDDPWTHLAGYVALGLCAGALVGAANGAIVMFLRVPPLVTTISVNSILVGLALVVSKGRPTAAHPLLVRATFGTLAGVPLTVWVLALVTLAIVATMSSTVLGRRFSAVSINARAAHAIGIPVARYRIATYALAGACYALAAVVMAGYLSLPGIFSGNGYMLATVATFVVAGNDVSGRARGSFLATVLGAFFLTYLDQFLLALDFSRASQDILQALIVLAGVGLPTVLRRV